MNQADRELVQSGVDNELSGDDRESLETLLKESEQARQLFEELGGLTKLLATVPSLELPDGLHARIVDQAELPSQSWVNALFNNFTLMPVLRYGFAAVLGLLVGLSVFESRNLTQTPGDFSNMVGTISSGRLPAQGDVLDSFEIDQGDVTGMAQLSSEQGLYLLEINLSTPEMVGLDVDLSAVPLKFNALARMDSDLDSINVNQAGIEAAGSGNVRLLVMLEKTGDLSGGEEQGISLSIKQDGAQIQAGWLAPGK